MVYNHVSGDGCDVRSVVFFYYVVRQSRYIHTQKLRYTLANLIPFFDDFVELVGSMLSPFLAFLFPCIFYLKTLKMSSVTIEQSERIVIYGIIALGISVILFGTTASIRDLVHHTEEYGAPFDCFCESKTCYLVENE